MILKIFTLGIFLTISNVFATGGSGIGGGVSFAVINWCDDANIMIQEAGEDAIERLKMSNDKIGALRVFYQGLIAAARTSENTKVDQANSLTYRAIVRGIELAQLLNIPSIIDGSARLEPGVSKEMQILGAISLMNWYYNYIQKVASAVDIPNYIYYSTRGGAVDLATLEKSLISLTLLKLDGLDVNFVSLKSDGSSFFTTIPVTQFLRSLSYLSKIAASDLQETIFSNGLDCQSKRLIRLSRLIQTYLDARSNSSEDAIKLNRFILDLRTISRQIMVRTCSY
jgi:hypothetical protein